MFRKVPQAAHELSRVLRTNRKQLAETFAAALESTPKWKPIMDEKRSQWDSFVQSEFDVFVLPSDHEGLPLSLLEAMALGKPSVVTGVGGVPEVVRNGEAIVVPPRDPEALTEGIATLLRDPSLRMRIGEAARRRAEDFDIRKAARRMEEVYQELLS